MKISEIITDKYKLRIPPTVYYDLLADVQEVEEEQEPTTKNDKVDCEHTDCNNCVNHKYCDYELTTKHNSSELAKNSKKLEKDFGESDCISRKAILDELEKWDWQELYLPIHFKENIVDVLPSVTPQEPTDKNFTKADIDAIVKAINEGWELRVNEILSKIRAEIKKLQKMCDKNDLNLMAQYSAFGMVLDILDRYKPESER